ncbi:MAG: energy-coupling factor transporter transmembrane component T [Bacillota bacterium]|nr:energy-coupling factor transporter transmembrane component T [Bacillota bacterium]
MLSLCVTAAWSSRFPAPPAASALVSVLLICATGGMGRHLPPLVVYPLAAGSLFSALMAPTLSAFVLMLSRLLSISSCLVLVAGTTPVNQVLSLTAWFLPPVVNDALLATYRSLFVLLERLDTRLAAAKIRGLRPGTWRDMAFSVSVVGNLLISAFDDATRAAEATGIRARGPLSQRQRITLSSCDWAPLSVGLVYAGLALAGGLGR